MSFESVVSLGFRQTFSPRPTGKLPAAPAAAVIHHAENSGQRRNFRIARVFAVLGKALEQARTRRRTGEELAYLRRFDSTLLVDIGIDKAALGRGELRRLK